MYPLSSEDGSRQFQCPALLPSSQWAAPIRFYSELHFCPFTIYGDLRLLNASARSLNTLHLRPLLFVAYGSKRIGFIGFFAECRRNDNVAGKRTFT